MKKFVSLSFTKILAVSAVIVLAVHSGLGVAADMKENAAYKNGTLVQTELAAEDFTMQSMVERKKDGTVKYVATDSDPQLHCVVNGLFTNMTFSMENSMPGTEIVVYYTTAEGQDFSENQRLWAQLVQGSENTYRIEIPMQHVHTLRIDPTVTGGSFLTFGNFEMNT